MMVRAVCPACSVGRHSVCSGDFSSVSVLTCACVYCKTYLDERGSSVIPPDSARDDAETFATSLDIMADMASAGFMTSSAQEADLRAAASLLRALAALKVGVVDAASPLVERLRAALVYLCNAMDKAEGHSIADAYLRARALLAESIQEGPQ